MFSKLVSICLPTYNGARYLEETLYSICAQTYQNFEVIISDDASIDNTIKLIEEFKKQSDFPVCVLHHTPSFCFRMM